VRWQEWWLAHKKLPASLKSPLRLESIEVSGGWQTDSYREDLRPLKFAARPRRKLELPGWLTPGANSGPGKLPFPTCEQTILPLHLSGGYRNRLEFVASSGCYAFGYSGRDCSLNYCFDPRTAAG
jgi:hypothetical protein